MINRNSVIIEALADKLKEIDNKIIQYENHRLELETLVSHYKDKELNLKRQQTELLDFASKSNIKNYVLTFNHHIDKKVPLDKWKKQFKIMRKHAGVDTDES